MFTFTVFGDDQFFQLDYGPGVRFLLDASGKRVWVTYEHPRSIDDVAIYFRGPVMGFLLGRRGVVSLHASSVCVGKYAIAMCGESEAGKSTTAAALALRGIPVLCEDTAALSEENEEFHVESGCPRVCLWPDAVESLLGSLGALPRLSSDWNKRYLALDGSKAQFETERRKLGAVYLLAPRELGENAPRIEEISLRHALLELVKNTYMNWLMDRNQRAAEFDVLSRLVMRVQVRRIVPHTDPARIGVLCDLILSDAERVLSEPRCATFDAL